jgi:type IV conjugative transfer system protein TraL
MAECVNIPRYVDELPQFALWEMDEALFVFISIAIGVLIKQLIIFIVLGFTAAYIFGRFKQGQARGLLMHYMHYHGFMPFKNFWLDFNYKREWMY